MTKDSKEVDPAMKLFRADFALLCFASVHDEGYALRMGKIKLRRER